MSTRTLRKSSNTSTIGGCIGLLIILALNVAWVSLLVWAIISLVKWVLTK